jgi:hypothetical protein
MSTELADAWKPSHLADQVSSNRYPATRFRRHPNSIPAFLSSLFHGK